MVTISFTLARQQFELSADDVRTRLAQRRPDPIDQYWVEIDDIRWPVKQVMALATGLGKSDFQSQNSRRLLAKLGFTIGKGNAPLSPEAGTSSTARRAQSSDRPVRFVGGRRAGRLREEQARSRRAGRGSLHLRLLRQDARIRRAHGATVVHPVGRARSGQP